MSASPGDAPPPTPPGDAGAAALVEAMEAAPAGIWFLAGAAAEPVWANARARALGASRSELPVVGGRPVVELVDAALRSGRADTASGSLGSGGPSATAVVRPMEVAGRPGVLV